MTLLSHPNLLLYPLSWYLLVLYSLILYYRLTNPPILIFTSAVYLSYALGWSDLVLFTIWVHAVAVDTKFNSQKVLSFAARAPHAIRVNVFSFKNHRDLKICIFIYFFLLLHRTKQEIRKKNFLQFILSFLNGNIGFGLGQDKKLVSLKFQLLKVKEDIPPCYRVRRNC